MFNYADVQKKIPSDRRTDGQTDESDLTGRFRLTFSVQKKMYERYVKARRFYWTGEIRCLLE